MQLKIVYKIYLWGSVVDSEIKKYSAPIIPCVMDSPDFESAHEAEVWLSKQEKEQYVDIEMYFTICKTFKLEAKTKP